MYILINRYVYTTVYISNMCISHTWALLEQKLAGFNTCLRRTLWCQDLTAVFWDARLLLCFHAWSYCKLCALFVCVFVFVVFHVACLPHGCFRCWRLFAQRISLQLVREADFIVCLVCIFNTNHICLLFTTVPLMVLCKRVSLYVSIGLQDSAPSCRKGLCLAVWMWLGRGTMSEFST